MADGVVAVLRVHACTCTSICLSICLPTHLSVTLSVYLSIHPKCESVCLSVHLSIGQSRDRGGDTRAPGGAGDLHFWQNWFKMVGKRFGSGLLSEVVRIWRRSNEKAEYFVYGCKDPFLSRSEYLHITAGIVEAVRYVYAHMQINLSYDACLPDGDPMPGARYIRIYVLAHGHASYVT